MNVIQPLLKAAGINQFRYGGGSYADYYDWRTNTNIGKCLPDGATASFTAGCASRDALGFGQFSRQARAIGADSFATVNYGSGTPAQAAAWVAAAARTPGEGVALWEVGNETYGCWEVDNELAGPPANYRGYKPSLTGGANPTGQQVLRSLLDIPSLYGTIRAGLNAHHPSASVVIGETAVSNSPTTTGCTPVGALFAAGDVLSWLSAGAESVDWWDMNNYGNTTSRCVRPDYGFFTSSSPPAAETPYYGYLLASVLARPHALLGTLATSDPSDVLGFQSVLPDGRHAVAFININTQSARTVTFQPSAALAGTLRTWRYRAPAGSGVVTGTASAASVANGITLPAEPITVLETR